MAPNVHHADAKGRAVRHPLFHSMAVPDDVGRQVNGDWSFWSTLRGVLTAVCHCYDINCQWSCRVWDRLSNFPKNMRPSIGRDDITFKIPKLHMEAHQWKCHPKYSLNYSTGVGRLDGEGIERKWAATGQVASSAAEMSPGAHHEFLDDVLGFQNHKKVINLGESSGGCMSNWF